MGASAGASVGTLSGDGESVMMEDRFGLVSVKVDSSVYHS